MCLLRVFQKGGGGAFLWPDFGALEQPGGDVVGSPAAIPGIGPDLLHRSRPLVDWPRTRVLMPNRSIPRHP